MGQQPEKTPLAQVLATLKWLHAPGEVFEICLIGPKTATDVRLWTGRAGAPAGKKATVTGWFRNLDQAARLAVQLKGEGVYTTLNPCPEALLARASERLQASAKRTQDKEITHLRNFFIDIDPIRPAGISSTAPEHAAALTMIREIAADLALEGWPAPLLGDSGNGGHLLYPLELENDITGTGANVALIKGALQGLAGRYAARLQELRLEIDQTVFNPARISKIYGTVAAKGDNVPERPHRRAQILSLPGERVPVAAELLARAAGWADKISPGPPLEKGGEKGVPAGKPALDVAAYLAHYGKEVVKVKEHGSSVLYCLAECVFDPGHEGNEAAVGQTAEGALFYQCFHNSCRGRLWVEARQLISGNDKLGRFMPGGGPRLTAINGGKAKGGAAGTPAPPGEGGEEEEELPRIMITHRFLQEKSGEALAALEKGNDPPVLFVRAGALARVLVDEQGMPRIDTMSDLALRGLICRRALFFKQTDDGPRPAAPPMEIPRDILALGTWPFPALEGITSMPIMRPDGSLHLTPGYDAATRLFYAADAEMTFYANQVPEEPEEEMIEYARYMLEEVIQDFPFAAEADKANALALMCTLPLRPMIGGLSPLAVITAPTPGTGKSLLADIVALIGTGKVAPMDGLSSNDEETRKLITSLLDNGAPLICFDNVEGELRAPSLARALTCNVWEDRILGKTGIVSLPQRAMWLATGNNVQLRGDLPRRTYPIRVDAQLSKPWERTAFKYEDLRGCVRRWRADILAAIFILARAWIQAGRPGSAEELPILGGFEAWARTLGGILGFAGVAGFLQNLADFHGVADQEGAEWAAFLEVWRGLLGENACTCAEVEELLKEHETFVSCLPENLGDIFKNPKRSFARSLGKALKKKENRPYGEKNLTIKRGGEVKGVIRWRVTGGGGAGPAAAGPRQVGLYSGDSGSKPRR